MPTRLAPARPCMCSGSQVKAQTERVEQELEAEQEFLVNKLMRRTEAVEAERDAAAEACAEAERARDAAQAKLESAKAEKVALEQRLEAEQEYITNRLSRQLASVQAEKAALEAQQHSDVQALLGSIRGAVARLGGQPSEGGGDSQAVLARLEAQLSSIQGRLSAKARAEGAAAAAAAPAQAELRKLREENWLLRQRIAAGQDALHERVEQVAASTLAEELDSERAFNSGAGVAACAAASDSASGVLLRSHLTTTGPEGAGVGMVPSHAAGLRQGGRTHSAEGSEGMASLAPAHRGDSWPVPGASRPQHSTEGEEEDSWVSKGRSGHGIFPAALADMGRGRDLGSATPPSDSPSLPPAGVSSHPPPLPGAELEGAERWRRSLGVEGLESLGGSTWTDAFHSGGGVPVDLSSGTPSVGGGDASSVTGSVSGMSSVSDADRASAALVESGVEAIKSAWRRQSQSSAPGAGAEG